MIIHGQLALSSEMVMIVDSGPIGPVIALMPRHHHSLPSEGLLSKIIMIAKMQIAR
jgi:hypothetical protein